MEPVTESITVGFKGRKHNLSVRYRSGSGDLLIFMHGMGCSKKNFSNAWDQKAFSDYALLALDFVGFGDSVKPDDFSYALEDQAAIVSRLFRLYPEPRRHIVAHSMGAGVALLMPRTQLDRLSSFICVEGNLIAQDCFVSRKVSERPFDEFQKQLLPKLKARLFQDPDQFADLETASPLAYYQSSASLVAWSDSGKLLKTFREMTCRKAYFYGQRNAGIEVLNQIEGITKIEIEKCGHMMMLDNPDDFYRKLAYVLDGL